MSSTANALPYTAAVERATHHLYERVRHADLDLARSR